MLSSEEVFELQTTQKEADTKVFLCCQHAAKSGYQSTCIYTVDSDIPLYALYFTGKILIDIYVLIGTKKKDCRTSQLYEKSLVMVVLYPCLHYIALPEMIWEAHFTVWEKQKALDY